VKWGLFKRDSRDRIPNHAGIREGKRVVRGKIRDRPRELGEMGMTKGLAGEVVDGGR
jgi:hypothetical protein